MRLVISDTGIRRNTEERVYWLLGRREHMNRLQKGDVVSVRECGIGLLTD